jgi:hypothetical protein
VGENWPWRLQLAPELKAGEVAQAGMLLLPLAAGVRVICESVGDCAKSGLGSDAGLEPMLVSVKFCMGLDEPSSSLPKLKVMLERTSESRRLLPESAM